MLFVTPAIQIPESEFEFSYARSSGPGGQNVNKVNSKALLRWNLAASTSMGLDLQARLMTRLRPRLTLAGEIVVSSDRFRDQTRNREDCIEKLRAMLVAAAVEPKRRKKTKPSRSSVRRTKELKSRNSAKKSLRQRPRNFD